MRYTQAFTSLLFAVGTGLFIIRATGSVDYGIAASGALFAIYFAIRSTGSD